MGFSMRTDRWRVTRWGPYSALTGRPAFELPPTGVELYDHANDTMADFDAYENVDLASDPQYVGLGYSHACLVLPSFALLTLVLTFLVGFLGWLSWWLSWSTLHRYFRFFPLFPRYFRYFRYFPLVRYVRYLQKRIGDPQHDSPMHNSMCAHWWRRLDLSDALRGRAPPAPRTERSVELAPLSFRHVGSAISPPCMLGTPRISALAGTTRR